jgi:serine/threonine protein kinase
MKTKKQSYLFKKIKRKTHKISNNKNAKKQEKYKINVKIQKNANNKKTKYFKVIQVGGKIECIDEIGAGDYGNVYSCKDNKIIAVKKLLTSRSDTAKEEFENEINIMRLLQKSIYEKYILQYIDYITIEGGEPKLNNYYYSEYCNLGSLLDYYSTNKEYSQEQNPDIITNILSGLCYLFDESIIHSDIRVDNILVQQVGGEKFFKIADFGKGYILGKDVTVDLTTLPYGYSAVPNYLLYSTYFRDLHGLFIIILNLYNNFQSCDYYTSRQTVLYPIKFGNKLIQQLIKILYDLQTELLKKNYIGFDNKNHNEILISSNYYGIKGECVTLIANDAEDELPPLLVGNNDLPSLPDANNDLPPLPSVKSVPGANNDLPPLPSSSPAAANNSPINIDITEDRAIYEPVYAKIKKLL